MSAPASPVIQLSLLLLLSALSCFSKLITPDGSDCPPYSFKCSDGQCIKETSVCDGSTECRDGSDETQATCSKFSIECPSYAFRCAYGACIDKKKTCNDVKDCADNSDELLPQCEKNPARLTNSICKKHEFSCNSGQCIDETSLCDGSSDCYDGSDETITQCINVRCPGYSFQCAYGGCIDKEKKCNGIEDCKDGSDEDSELCNSPTTKKPSRPTTTHSPIAYDGCPLPARPNGGDYDVVECSAGDRSAKCRKVPGTVVKFFTVLRFSCHDGFALPGQSENSFCNNDGKWVPPPAECQKLCPPLLSETVSLSCTYLSTPVNCSQPMRPKTRVEAACRPAFHLLHPSDGFRDTECLADGSWADPLFVCSPDCGVKNSVRQLISYAPTTESEYPWHVGLYRKYGKDYICGGSIVSEKAILTAAHCVYNDTEGKTIPLEDFRVAAGKFRRSWDLVDKNEQRFEVLEIIKSSYYLGSNNRYEHDIAVIHIRGVIRVNPTVMPVCIDKFSSYHIRASDVGTVVGWGITENGTVSDLLRVAKLPYYDFNSCREQVSVQFSHYISYDKFCAGLRNGTQLGAGDSGGGLTFPRVIDSKEIHFLYGIVSVTDTENHDITAFTNVTVHFDSESSWLRKVLDAIRRSRDSFSLIRKNV